MEEERGNKGASICADGIYEIGREIFGVGRLISYIQESEEKYDGVRASHLRVLEKLLYQYGERLITLSEEL